MKRLLAVILILGAFVAAQAQYTLTSMSGGSASGSGTSGIETSGNTITAYGAGQGCQASGTFTFTWQWNGAGPAPQYVILTVTPSASWAGSPNGGSCDDDLGDPASPASGSGHPITGQTSSGTHYFIEAGGATVTYDLDPQANSSGGSAWVSLQVTLTPVIVSVAGGLFPNTNGDECMVGQWQQASISAGGFQFVQGSVNWTVSGGTPEASVYWGVNGGPPANSKPTAHWYNPITSVQLDSPSPAWFQPAPLPAPETCTGYATVVNPANGEALGVVSGTYSMAVQGVQSYALEAVPTTGESYLDGSPTYPTAIDTELPDGDPGINFTFSESDQLPFILKEGTSDDFIVQLCEVNFSQTLLLSPFSNSVSNSNFGLDTSYPYNNDGTTSDSPDVGLYGPPNPTTSVSVNDQFVLFNVITPPANGLGASVDTAVIGQDWSWMTSDQWGGLGGTWGTPTFPSVEAGAYTGLYPYNQFTWNYVFTGRS